MDSIRRRLVRLAPARWSASCFKVLTNSYVAIWAWIGLVLSLGIAAGAWLSMQAVGESLSDLKASVTTAASSATAATKTAATSAPASTPPTADPSAALSNATETETPQAGPSSNVDPA